MTIWLRVASIRTWSWYLRPTPNGPGFGDVARESPIVASSLLCVTDMAGGGDVEEIKKVIKDCLEACCHML